jgi:hypothetical protein
MVQSEISFVTFYQQKEIKIALLQSQKCALDYQKKKRKKKKIRVVSALHALSIFFWRNEVLFVIFFLLYFSFYDFFIERQYRV